jgi:hypothetical protein
VSAERDKIAARIRALLAKTVENGCTEDEAVSAAAKAAEMLARYNLTVDEVHLRETPFAKHAEQHDDEVGSRLWKVADGIAYMTGCRYWSSAPGFRTEVTFFGFAHEVEIARYLLDICARAMRQEDRRLNRIHGLLVPRKRRMIILPFLDGMADRLRERIRALKPAAPTGKGLVVLRGALIDAALADEGIETRDGRGRASRDLEGSYVDGRLAADRVALNRAVNGAAINRLLSARG